MCSTRNVELVRSIGADHVIDYAKEDFTSNGQRYDLLFEGVGSRRLMDCRRALTPEGTIVMVGARRGRWVAGFDRAIAGIALFAPMSQRFVTFVAVRRKEDLEFLNTLLESGKVTPVLDRSYPLSASADAIRYLEEGRARGKVVITVDTNG